MPDHLKRLHDDQNNNTNHQYCRYLIDNPVEFLAAGIPVLSEFSGVAGIKPVDCRHYEDEDELEES